MASTTTNDERDRPMEENERESMKRAIAREEAGSQPLKFLNLPDFPINSPKLNNVHIIDTDHFYEETVKRHLRCVDAAATVLYKCDPDALSKFLDPKIEKFSFFRGDGWHLPFKLIRTRNFLEMGYLKSKSKADSREWGDSCLRFKGSEDLKEWNVITATAYGMTSTKAEWLRESQEALAKAMIYNGLWRKGGSTEFKVEIGSVNEADMISAGIEKCRYCPNTTGDEGKALLRCTRCRCALYCSKECQKADWKAHKILCS